MYKALKPMYESAGIDYDPEAEVALSESEDLMEGLKEVIQAARLKRFESKVMQKGTNIVYFVRIKSSKSFGKATFENGQLQDAVRYESADEMEADIAALEADGYKLLKENGIKSFVKLVVRNIGRMKMISGGLGFIIGSMLIVSAIATGGAALGGLAAIVGLESVALGSISYGFGWMMANVASKRNALRDDEGEGAVNAVRTSLGESMASPEDLEKTIRELVRETIKSAAEAK